MNHELKTHPAPFQAVFDGAKRFEYRLNDRDFKQNDTLTLKEYDPTTQTYSGREAYAYVLYCLYGGQYGVPEGYVIMSIDVAGYKD